MRYEWRAEGRTVIVRDEQEIGAALEYRIDPPDNRLGHTAIFLREILRLAAERERVRRELLASFGPHALITDKMGDRMEPLLDVLDRIAPTNEGKEE